MRIVPIILLVLAAAPAGAAWEKVNEGQYLTNYTDPPTLRKLYYNRTIWELQDLKAPDANGARSRSLLAEYDCAGERMRVRSLKLYSGPMGTGETLPGGVALGNWERLAEASVADNLFRHVCAR